MSVLDKQILTLDEYVKNLHNQLKSTLGSNTNIIPKNFPISRGTLYNMRNGGNVTIDTIKKSCNYLNIPEPKIFF